MGAVALPLTLAAGVAGAQPKPVSAPASKAAPDAAGNPASWVADELRILRAEVESLRQRPDTSLGDELAALRAEVAKLASTQAELERRLGMAASPGLPAAPAERGAGAGLTRALAFLALGAALGWVGGRLTQRWRDRRQRIRV